MTKTQTKPKNNINNNNQTEEYLYRRDVLKKLTEAETRAKDPNNLFPFDKAMEIISNNINITNQN